MFGVQLHCRFYSMVSLKFHVTLRWTCAQSKGHMFLEHEGSFRDIASSISNSGRSWVPHVYHLRRVSVCRADGVYPFYGPKTTFWHYDDYCWLCFGRNSKSLAIWIVACSFSSSIAASQNNIVLRFASVYLSCLATCAECYDTIWPLMGNIPRMRF